MKLKLYVTPAGRSPVEEFLAELPTEVRADIFDGFLRLEAGEILPMPLSRSLAGIHQGLHELRFKDKGGQIRVIYYFKKGDAVYVVHAFRKKTQLMPGRERDLILKRLKEV